MAVTCPYCSSQPIDASAARTVIRCGSFYRKSDSRKVQRFYCHACEKGFSRATSHACYRQNKRQLNEPLRRLLCSGVSQRRAAYLLNISRTTVVRKFLFLAAQAQNLLKEMNQSEKPAEVVEFDDMESFEHTKCKPLSITLAVESEKRRILSFAVTQMPAKGPLAAIARKKYGPRDDHRPQGRKRVFESIAGLIRKGAVIKSDQNPHYLEDVKRHFPDCAHERHKGRRGCVVGQGELKKIGFDPLFSLNHTCAKLRADINRLFRRTWCTTKKAERLSAHIAIYAVFHNERLKAC